MTVAPYSKNDNRLYVQGSAVIFFFYLRFFKFAIITIKTISTISASVVIISNCQVQTKNHKHHSFLFIAKGARKDMTPFTFM